MTNSIKNKVILVLGGGGDIGSAISDRLEKEGATVVRHDLIGEYAADVHAENQLSELIGKILKKFGRVDAIINSVSAPAEHGDITKKGWPDFLAHLTVQLKAAVETAHYLVPQMKDRGGKIINILTSYVAGDPPAGLADYVSAKYALLGLTKALAKELNKYKIAVNAISPSLIRNSFTKKVPEKLIEMTMAETPSGRLTTAVDVADAVAFLFSAEGDQLTGANILINGGERIIQ